MGFPPSSPGVAPPAKSWRSQLSPLPLPLLLMIAALAAAATVAWWLQAGGYRAQVVATCPAADAALLPGMPSVQAQLDELRAELARLAAAHQTLLAELDDGARGRGAAALVG